MENCKNCKHCSADYDLVFDMQFYVCKKANKRVLFPFFMGGSKKCECYEKSTKQSGKFQYPKKDTTAAGGKEKSI